MEPKEFRAAVKRAILACEGSVTNAAMLLGMDVTVLSRHLNHRGLVNWWTSYKAKRSLERLRARGQRKRHRAKIRGLLEAGYDPTTAEFLASQRYRGRSAPPVLPYPPGEPSD